MARRAAATALPPAPNRIEPQPCFTTASLYRLVTSEFHAIAGAITSTRPSMAAVTSWMAPP